jgi:hypothetical protein
MDRRSVRRMRRMPRDLSRCWRPRPRRRSAGTGEQSRALYTSITTRVRRSPLPITTKNAKDGNRSRQDPEDDLSFVLFFFEPSWLGFRFDSPQHDSADSLRQNAYSKVDQQASS